MSFKIYLSLCCVDYVGYYLNTVMKQEKKHSVYKYITSSYFANFQFIIMKSLKKIFKNSIK